ncbi:hypothetical protein J5N97_026214 [Dioscorea zingiberensis]|uniref:ribose-phosphate diphosphokinase n=1 Tax=Dioscorea zingiberensis TaxID=325984 RepID=A0A9D5C1N1_9LILI|nr:hypothetical protein J5N97_026214 [Dioscorea zingiberensis]
MAAIALSSPVGASKYRIGFPTLGLAAARFESVRCEVSKAFQVPNGRLCAPMSRDLGIPMFLGTHKEQGLAQKSDTKLRIFSGTANLALAQPTCPPVNENLCELLIMIDACRRASARTITAVIPYFGYARADRKTQGRESIAAKLTANLITKAGADRVLACDLHSGQSMGYFDIFVDHVYGEPVILDYLASKKISAQDLVVVSPGVGGVARSSCGFAKKLSDAPLAIVDKRRQGHNISEVMNLIGDVKGKVAVMVDDMIDTAGTITSAAALLQEEGARAVLCLLYTCSFQPSSD